MSGLLTLEGILREMVLPGAFITAVYVILTTAMLYEEWMPGLLGDTPGDGKK